MTTDTARWSRARGTGGGWATAGLAVAAVVWVASIVDLVASSASSVVVATSVVLTLVMVGAGAIIVLRTAVPVMGWLLVLTGATLSAFSAADLGDPATMSSGELVWLSLIGLSPVPLLAVIVLFPTGRPSTTFVRLVLVGGVGAQVVTHGAQVVVAAGWGAGDWTAWRGAADTAVGVMVMAVLVMHATTYRRRSRTEQLQLKYLVLALGLGAVLFLFSPSGGALTLVDLPRSVTLVLDSIGPGLIPVAIVLAMTRYRLYDVDRFVSRTLAYAIVVAVLGTIFVGGVALVAGLLPTQDQLPVALTTLAVIALFDPLRRRVVDAVDRRFDRRRYVARQVVERFGREVQDVTDAAAVHTRLCDVLGSTVAPATVAVWEPGGAR